MTWFAVADTNTGSLVSIADVLADPFPANLTAYPLGGRPDLQAVMWDANTRAFITRPSKVLIDRWQDLLSDPTYVDFQTIYSALNAQRKTQVQAVFVRLFGKQRYRNVSETIEVG